MRYMHARVLAAVHLHHRGGASHIAAFVSIECNKNDNSNSYQSAFCSSALFLFGNGYARMRTLQQHFVQFASAFIARKLPLLCDRQLLTSMSTRSRVSKSVPLDCSTLRK